jgi:hypothetical protein
MSSDGGGDETGYGKPPQRTRSQEVQSGNPKHQYPKRVESTVELIDKLLLKPIEITVGEKSRKVTTLEAILFRLWQKEVLVDAHALKIRLQLQDRDAIVQLISGIAVHTDKLVVRLRSDQT